MKTLPGRSRKGNTSFKPDRICNRLYIKSRNDGDKGDTT